MAKSTEEALVWGHTIEGLIRCGKPRATPRWEAQLRAAGLDLNRPTAPAYTRAQWRSYIFISAEQLFEGSMESRLEQLGKASSKHTP